MATTAGLLACPADQRLHSQRPAAWRQRRQRRPGGCPTPWGTCRQRVRAAAQGPGGGGDEGGGPLVDGSQFLLTATLGNSGMAAAGVALGNWQGLDVAGQLLHGELHLAPSLSLVCPLLAACAWGVQNADTDPGFRRMRQVFQAALIPQLAATPGGLWGLGLLALGAGVGEEVLFRGFVQAAADSGLAGALPALPPAAATAAALAGTSVAFGALHALTPLYFAFATAAGALFGIEYVLYGLPTAAVTHWVYDWLALVYILQEWGGGSAAAEGE